MTPVAEKFAWEGRRCLVTGARGFLGSALCARLSEHRAVVFPSGRGAAPAGAADRWHDCDVGDPDAVGRVFASVRPDTVFHLAAPVTGSRDVNLVWPTMNAIVGGTVNVLTSALRTEARRVVCLGSLQEPDDRLRAPPPSPYGAAKYAASAYARMFAEVYGAPVSIARPFMAFGAGQTDFTKVVPHILSKLLTGATADLSSGRQAFDWVYVDDVVDAMLAVAASPAAIGQTVDIGCGTLTSVRDIALGLARRVGRLDALRFDALPDRKLEPTRQADLEATARLTGWRPRVMLEEGLDRTVAWYRGHFS
jgi:nucleoside-diphosphate-sugar epimerase